MNAAIGRVGCGCDAEVRARSETDQVKREVALNDAPIAQRRWRCPAAGYVPTGELDADCLDARAQVALVAGCDPSDLGPTCPLLLTRLEWVHRVARARKWAERGLLEQYEGAVSAAEFEAIDVLDEAIAAKDARDAEERERELEAKRRGLPPPIPPNG